MTSLLRVVLLVVVASLASGCTIYFGGDDTGDDCYYEDDYWLGYRDPWTGLCQDWGGGGGCVYPQDDQADLAEPPPDWASCPGACEGLDEASCLDTAGCRGAYLDSCPPDADCDEWSIEFLECWGTAPTGPILYETCWGLDAYDCSRTDECIAVYANSFEGQMAFSHCAPEQPEPVGCELIDCAAGYHCEEVCTGGGDCTPDGECPPPECWSECVPDEVPVACESLGSEEECAARPDCTAVYDGFGCTCYPDGSCTCDEWVYAACETGGGDPVPF